MIGSLAHEMSENDEIHWCLSAHVLANADDVVTLLYLEDVH